MPDPRFVDAHILQVRNVDASPVVRRSLWLNRATVALSPELIEEAMFLASLHANDVWAHLAI